MIAQRENFGEEAIGSIYRRRWGYAISKLETVDAGIDQAFAVEFTSLFLCSGWSVPR